MSQRELAELRERYRELNAEKKALKRELALLKASRSSPSAAPPAATGIEADLKEVKTLAKKYTALYEPFSSIYNDPNLFMTPRPPSDCLAPERRFSRNKTARRDGWLAQLYAFLPEHLHGMVRNHSAFGTEVSNACGYPPLSSF